MRTVLIFIDGLGWGRPDPATNPQMVYGGQRLRLPGVPCLGDQVSSVAGGWARALDAVLGIAGVPQSATGQTTLLSGVNAQGRLGKHLTGFPNEPLREILRRHSLLKTLAELGLRVRFLNAFRPLFFTLPTSRQWTLSATTVANLAADLPFCTLEDLRCGRSLYHDFTNGALLDRGFEVPERTSVAAGLILAQVARANDFIFYEYFQTDKAGHAGDMQSACGELEKLDAFLGALLAELAPDLAVDTLVLLTSDHGNLEDVTTRRHTTNPVPLLAWGQDGKEFLADLSRLDQVTPAIVARHRADNPG